MKNTPEKKYDVFISHSSKDDHLAMEIYKYLTQNNVTCWLDTCSILPGEPYSASIMRGLNASRCFMLLYTKNVIGSGHILNEIDNAYNKKKHILTYVVDKTPMSEELNYYLSRPQQIHSYPNYREKLSVLLSAIKDVHADGGMDLRKNSTSDCNNRKVSKWWWTLLLLPLLALGLWLGIKPDDNILPSNEYATVCIDSIPATTDNVMFCDTTQDDMHPTDSISEVKSIEPVAPISSAVTSLGTSNTSDS